MVTGDGRVKIVDFGFRRKQNTAASIVTAPTAVPAAETVTAKRSLVRCICQKSAS